jgi:hypothetical protein
MSWARRKPMYLLRMAAGQLVRYDERKSSGVSFQEPPRITR